MRSFGHYRPDGIYSPVRAKTRATLGPNYGPDEGKALVVSCGQADLISIRPIRTARTVSISVFDLYALLLRKEADKKAAEKRKRKYANR